jgi:hypothetical protein
VFALAVEDSFLASLLEQPQQLDGGWFFVTAHPCIVGDRYSKSIAFFPLGIEDEQRHIVSCELLWHLCTTADGKVQRRLADNPQQTEELDFMAVLHGLEENQDGGQGDAA